MFLYMKQEKTFAVYIMGNERPTLYTGVTNSLPCRVQEHKIGKGGKFTSKYKLTKLLYYEITDTPYVAIEREKEIKKMSRIEKLQLIEARNPLFVDLWNEIKGEWGGYPRMILAERG